MYSIVRNLNQLTVVRLLVLAIDPMQGEMSVYYATLWTAEKWHTQHLLNIYTSHNGSELTHLFLSSHQDKV